MSDNDKIIVDTVLATLLHVADWLTLDTEKDMIHGVRNDLTLNRDNLGDICPICEEVICDGSCPLAPVRDPLNDVQR